MNEAMQRIKRELDECSLTTYLVEGVADDIIAFNYVVPTGRYRSKNVDIGLSMQEANYPEYPPHWIHVTPKIEDGRGCPGKEFTDSSGRVWVAFSRPPPISGTVRPRNICPCTFSNTCDALEKRVRKEVVLTDEPHRKAKNHLLSFLEDGIAQENLCFGLWYPSQGAERFTAVVKEIVLPQPNEVQLHGNASFEGKYLTRATREAKRQGAGLVMMHSHPAAGWQDLSAPDIFAERDIVAYQAQSTKRPLLGNDYWEGRLLECSLLEP